MANLNAAIRQVRRARHQYADESSEPFDQYRAGYESILAAVDDLADDEIFDELLTWITETTEARRSLPSPSAVRRRARELCTADDIEIPHDSTLR